MTQPQTDSENNIAQVPGDGGPSTVRDEELQWFHEEIDLIVKSAAYGVTERRMASEDTRYCRWEGQSPDGRKHSDAHNGEPVFPYEGASDGRIRLADMIINERVLILLASVMRSMGAPKCRGLKLDDEAFGSRMATLLKWIVNNEWGSDFVREILKLANYQEGDSPAGGVLGVVWQQEFALRMERIQAQDLAAILTQRFGMSPEGLSRLQAQLMNPDQDEDSANLLLFLFAEAGIGQPPAGYEAEEDAPTMPGIQPKRARRIVRDLRKQGWASFPLPYLKRNRPMITAYRLFEDIFFPANTVNFERCRCFFLREWMSKTEVQETRWSRGYSEEFIGKVLEHEGQTGFPLIFNRPEGVTGDYSGQLIRQSYNPEIYRGLYEVITCFFKAVNDDGIPGVYMLPFSKCVADAPAKKRELCDYAHGEYPFVFFGRESLTQRLWDSRGVSELVMTDQHAMKLLHDAENDNVSLTTVPPIKVPRRRTNLRLVIGPLKQIKEERPGEISWMQPPITPPGRDQHAAQILNRVDQYWGRIAADVPPLLTQLHQEGLVRVFLANLTDALVMVLQLCQQYMSDEQLAEITGDNNLALARSVEEIQGKFHLQIGFDPRDLDINYVKTLAEVIAQLILPMDTLSTVQRDKLVQRLFTALEPSLAQETLRPVQSAQQDEVVDEQNNFAKIAAGVEPPMMAAGQNFGLRLQVLQNIGKMNPDAIRRLAPVSRQILQARMEQLANQVQQLQNAQIGRAVGKPALGQAGPDGGPSGAGGGLGAVTGGVEPGAQPAQTATGGF